MTQDSFRALHHRNRPFVIPNPWDTGSARICAALGFEALATTSAGMTYAAGRPEGSFAPDEVLTHCREIVAATALPVSADLERGFGDSPESAAETIRAAAETGLAGGSIEDHTGDPTCPIYDTGLAVERVAAAARAARTLPRDFVLTARCESLLWGETRIEAVIERLVAFEAAGADVLFAPGLRDMGAIREVCAALRQPVNILMAMPEPGFGMAELAEAGVARISVGSAFFRLAYGAFVDAAREILEHGTFTRTGAGIGFAEMENFFDPTAKA